MGYVQYSTNARTERLDLNSRYLMCTVPTCALLYVPYRRLDFSNVAPQPHGLRALQPAPKAKPAAVVVVLGVLAGILTGINLN